MSSFTSLGLSISECQLPGTEWNWRSATSNLHMQKLLRQTCGEAEKWEEKEEWEQVHEKKEEEDKEDNQDEE